MVARWKYPMIESTLEASKITTGHSIERDTVLNRAAKQFVLNMATKSRVFLLFFYLFLFQTRANEWTDE